jgi:predicted anti-sigma-YlaC factor YlaD
MEVRPQACERAAELVSLELDGELSLLERALLRRHLQRCEPCAAYARNVTAVTGMLRVAPLEQVRVQLGVWKHPRRLSQLVQSVAATAAVVTIAIGIAIGASGSKQRPGPAVTAGSASAGKGTNDRFDWSAGLPHSVQFVQLSPGGLYTASLRS